MLHLRSHRCLVEKPQCSRVRLLRFLLVPPAPRNDSAAASTAAASLLVRAPLLARTAAACSTQSHKQYLFRQIARACFACVRWWRACTVSPALPPSGRPNKTAAPAQGATFSRRPRFVRAALRGFADVVADADAAVAPFTFSRSCLSAARRCFNELWFVALPAVAVAVAVAVVAVAVAVAVAVFAEPML